MRWMLFVGSLTLSVAGGSAPRPQLHSGYYAAFIIDPDGNNIEAVLHD